MCYLHHQGQLVLLLPYVDYYSPLYGYYENSLYLLRLS
nr:MAG TPA: hypothetical protein [Caudoviricetes sp.]